MALAILVGVLALLSGGLGYGLGEQRRHRDETDTYIHQLEDRVDANAQRLQAHSALIEVIAEDYDLPNGREPTPEQRRAAFKVIRGGGAGAFVLALGTLAAWLRKHWRSVGTALAASGVTAVIAVGLLAHGSPPANHPQAGRSPTTPPGSTQTAYTTAPQPTTRPGHTPRRAMPPPPVLPARRKPSAPTPGQTAAAPQPQPRPPLSPVPTPRRPTPAPSPVSTCPVGVAVQLPGIGVTICV